MKTTLWARLLRVWFFVGALLTMLFCLALWGLWSSAKEYNAFSFEKQVLSALSNDLAEGNIFKLGAALGKGQKEGLLKFAEIRQFTEPGGWETFYKTQFDNDSSDVFFKDFTCLSSRVVKSHFLGGVSLGVVLPGEISGSDCVALYIDSDLPQKLKELRNRLVVFLILGIGIVVGLVLWYMLTWHKKIVLLETENLRSHIDKQDALWSLASQVAHDIRSPVFALDAALKDMAQLPEKQRVTVRHAVNRIRDVANGLLEKNRPRTEGTASNREVATEAKLLSNLIEPVITEKRLQYGEKPDIDIDFELSRESYGLFAKVQPVEFGRMLSNLINNSTEALGDKGKVDVRLTLEANYIVLAITDNGKGIPPEILSRLGQRGETHGKAGGSGLGLYHAMTTAENCGGSLAITSTPGKGTTVAIKLPKAVAPDGFVAVLELAPGRPVIVLDDDTGIHQIWRGRFEAARIGEQNIEALYFCEPEQLRAWVKAEPAKAKTAICLFDYELSGYKDTGLSLAEELGLCAQTILVTSRSEEKQIIKECSQVNVRLMAKGMAEYVPISISAPAAPARAVLLDDDALTHMTWEMAADAHGVGLRAFTKPDDFFAALGTFPKDIPLYIDSDLGENVKGEDIAAQLKEKGFINICLATAHPPEKFAHLPWLKVTTKAPPWA